MSPLDAVPYGRIETACAWAGTARRHLEEAEAQALYGPRSAAQEAVADAVSDLRRVADALGYALVPAGVANAVPALPMGRA